MGGTRRALDILQRILWAGLVAGRIVPTQAYAHDFQAWSTLQITKQLGPEWETFFLPEVRIRDNASEVFYNEFRQGVRWRQSKNLTLGLNYLYARNESSGKPLQEHTGELDVTPKVDLGPFLLSLRGRLARRAFEGKSKREWQIRFKPKIAYPIQLPGRTITPYIADDLYYDFTQAAWNQNRLFLGATVPLGKSTEMKVNVELYYMLQSQRRARKLWITNSILGTKLTVRF